MNWESLGTHAALHPKVGRPEGSMLTAKPSFILSGLPASSLPKPHQAFETTSAARHLHLTQQVLCPTLGGETRPHAPEHHIGG